MKQRYKNLITSVLGALLMVTGIVLYVLSKLMDFSVAIVELFAVEALGLLLLWAWNDLLQKFVQKTLRLNSIRAL